MKTTLFLSAICLAFGYSTANADLMLDSGNENHDSYTTSDYLIPPGTYAQSSNPTEQEIIDQINMNSGAYASVTDLGASLFKFDFPGDNPAMESGSLAGSYQVNYSDNTGGTLVYTGGLGGTIVDPNSPAWLLMKDGVVGWVVYDLTSTGSFGVNWNGIDSIVFSNNPAFLGSNGQYHNISHIEIYGSTTTTNELPGVSEPASVLLFGFGALGMFGLRFRKRRQTEQNA